MNNGSRRWRFRFSIFTLLFVTSCLSGWLAGYHTGYRNGDDVWKYKATTSKAYNVVELVVSIPNSFESSGAVIDFKPLLEILQKVIEPGQTPTPEIMAFPTNLSIVVTGNGIVHRRVTSLLSKLRKQSENAIAYNQYRLEQQFQSDLAKFDANN